VYDFFVLSGGFLRERFPVVFRASRQPLGAEDFIRLEADINHQIKNISEYVVRIDGQLDMCRRRARAQGVTRERRVALFGQYKRLMVLRAHADRQITVLDDSIMALQSNSMGLDLASAMRSVSKLCRGNLRGVDSDSLVSGIEESLTEINESFAMSSEIHDMFSNVCSTMNDTLHVSSVDEDELAEFLMMDSCDGCVEEVPVSEVVVAKEPKRVVSKYVEEDVRPVAEQRIAVLN
jgi:hypothetical protein